VSRLDSFIRRMTAQRDILDTMPARLGALPGPVYEFGLGSGRTYDHLRQLFPDRRIVVFESVVCEWVARPPEADFVIGDLRETAAAWPEADAALIHADIETGTAEIDRTLATWLPALVARLLRPGGYAVSGCPLPHPALIACPLPASIDPDRYHLAQRS
jgi:trans-aconitate methyltransferase